MTCPTHPCLLLGKKGRGVPTLPSPLSPPTCNLNQSKRRPGAGSTRASAGWISLLRIQDSSLSEPLPQVEIQEFCPSTLEESNISTAVRHITSCSLLDKLVANVRRSHFSSPLPRASHSLDYLVFRKLSSAVLPGTHTIRLPYQLLSQDFPTRTIFRSFKPRSVDSSLHP